MCHALMRTMHTHHRPHCLGMAPFGSLGVAVPLLLPSFGYSDLGNDQEMDVVCGP